jgi:PhnB protein
MPTINPHLHFNGNTEEAFLFYKTVFGGEVKKIIRFKELSTEGFSFPEDELNKIMHISLSIGNTSTISGSDVPSMLGTVNESENRSKITITANSKQEAEALFNGLSEGAAIECELGQSPWGSYFGSLRDKYGIEWMIEFVG